MEELRLGHEQIKAWWEQGEDVAFFAVAGGVGLGQFFAALAVLMQLEGRGGTHGTPSALCNGGELQNVHIPLILTSKIITPSRNSLSSKKKESLWTSDTIDAN